MRILAPLIVFGLACFVSGRKSVLFRRASTESDQHKSPIPPESPIKGVIDDKLKHEREYWS